MTAALWAFLPGFALYLAWKLRFDLHMLQLTSYLPERYWRWLKANATTFWQPKELYPLLALIPLALGRPVAAGVTFSVFYFLVWAGRPERPAKKPLVMTARTRRLLAGAFALAALATGLAASTGSAWVIAATLWACGVGSCLLMLGASALLLPLEKQFHQAYFRDAQRIIRDHAGLKVIGITGSYGKTSTKTFLGAILAEHADTLITPGSFNTPMGVSKVIRESLRPGHRFFVAEMGAREKGNIAELCRLAQPTVGIVTAIGEQHLETFKTVEVIKATKWELPSSIPADGLVIVCGDDANIADMLARAKPVAPVIRHGFGDDNDVRAADVRVGPEGSRFTIIRAGREPLEVDTRLLGRHNVANVCAAVAAATALGVPDTAMRIALRRLSPPEHRLELKRLPGRYVMLDDAYNSNPAGAAAALDILRQMPCPQRVLVTPGMVELGPREAELNREFGRQAASACDRIVLVGVEPTRPIQEGVRAAGFPEDHLHVLPDLNAAFALLARVAGPDDVVLFENDLPDSYRK
jgi:UDP-N-acetylmuramoyl-tripeptide--D-alanyl-D-alanine ligase